MSKTKDTGLSPERIKEILDHVKLAGDAARKQIIANGGPEADLVKQQDDKAAD